MKHVIKKYNGKLQIALLLYFFIGHTIVSAQAERYAAAQVEKKTELPDSKILFQSLPENFEYNGIRCILKDYKGFMWFGTDDGLIRYDGVNQYLYEYSADDSTTISHNSIISLAEDKNKNLWVGTAQGLCVYNREKDAFVQAGDKTQVLSRLNNTYISALYVGTDNRLWIGSFGYGLHTYELNNNILRHYPVAQNDPSTISSNRITCIAQDKIKNIWIGTQQGLIMFSNYTWQFQNIGADTPLYSDISNDHITSLEADSAGNIWVGSSGGGLTKISYHNNDFSFSQYNENSYPGRLSTNNVLTLDADEKGFLWIGTENGGLNRLNVKTDWIDVFQKQQGNHFSLNSNSIWSVYVDHQGRIWIGTYNAGINVIDEKYRKFESHYANAYNKNGLPDDDVTAFAADDQDNIWIATDGGGVSKYYPNSGNFRPLNHFTGNIQPLENTNIQSLLYDQYGALWIGTWGDGVYRFKNGLTTSVPYSSSKRHRIGKYNIFSIFEDKQQNIWVGTAGNGLFKLNPITGKLNPVTLVNPSDILTTDSYVTSILQDSTGILWVGTLHGLVQLREQADSGYVCTDLSNTVYFSALSSISINMLFKDSKQNIWIGTTDNGLNLLDYNADSIKVFQKKDGLPSNAIRGIAEDRKGNIWVTTNRGMVSFVPDSMKFTTYTTEDGLNSNEFYSRSILRSTAGAIYVGGENGFNIIVPDEISKNNVVPPVYLSSLKINNQPVVIGGKNSPLKKHISETREIILKHTQSSFTIEFIALNYTRPAHNQYKYKLEGFDEEWNDAGTNRSATYTNIRPGKYVFMVMGSNNDGVWNETPTQVTIEIEPPLWKTWWAILGYVLLTLTVIILFLRAWNERIRIKNELKLEKMAREREHELNESNIQFFTDISHEFRTPLSLIIAPLESLINRATPEIRKKLSLINKNAGRLLQLTNTLMDIRKLETGHTKVRVQHGDVFGFIREVASYFSVNAGKDNICFDIDIAEQGMPGWYDPDKLETIMVNLLSNAFKFTREKGYVRLSASLQTGKKLKEKYMNLSSTAGDDLNYLEVNIVDNGIGIPAEEIPRVFDKFYRTKLTESGKNMGTGVGLSLVKGLIKLMHGALWVESKENEGATFIFALPLDRAAFQEDEITTESQNKSGAPVKLKAAEIHVKDRLVETWNSMPAEEKVQILIVEDNDELRSFLITELQETYLVSEAKNGKEALKKALLHIPDLIISDILMPVMSGTELCNAIKTDIKTSHIPVILLTAKATVQDQIEGIQTGADIYITKPFSISLLKAQINNLIQSRKQLYAHFSQDVYLMPNQISGNKIDQQFIHKVIGYIEDHITESNLSVEDLASTLNLSRSNVYRKLKALTGKTIVEFIRMIRLKQAVKLMETQQYSLAEIAYQTGFTSPSYFTKMFKEQYGKPPSEYSKVK